MVVNDRPLKKMKRRVNADLYDFMTFPAHDDGGNHYSAEPFRTSVRTFLSKHARVPFPQSLFPSLQTWQILFRIGDPVAGADLSPVVVALDIVEEDVTRSRSVYCDQCRVVGWSANPVCRKRYHFIIRANSCPIDGYQKPCSICGHWIHLLDSRCKSCNTLITAEEVEEWVYRQFEDSTHLLHGVVHSNGYGHLLTVNGIEGGSNVLSGCNIMNFWDRLSRALSVRRVSVMDVSKKYGLEYRLLHAVMRGHPWYGEWGYEFGAGSYAVTLDAYQKAVDLLSSIPLTIFFFQGRKPQSHLQAVIAFYQSLSYSGLGTLQELFSFLSRLIRANFKPAAKNFVSEPPNVLCAWTRSDVEYVEEAMLKVLVAASGDDSKWVTRRALKRAMCKSASPELLDYCLKHFGGKLASNGKVVQARCNPTSEAIEFRLEAPDKVYNMGSNHPSVEQMIRDLKFLYESILHPETMVSYRPQATRELVEDSAAKLLDCKQFVKDYKLDELAIGNPFALHIWCHVELADEPRGDPAPPPELIFLPVDATVGDLKKEATKAFQEVYAMFKRFQAEEFLDYGPIDDSMTLKFLVGSSGSVRVRGRCQGKHALSRFRMERGIENWTVDCTCGANDDDGERMLACDTCGVWQHTRCAGIECSDAIPAKFVCLRCVNKYCAESTQVLESDEKTKAVPQSGTTCMDEAISGTTCIDEALSGTTCRDEAISTAISTTNCASVDRITMTYGVGRMTHGVGVNVHC